MHCRRLHLFFSLVHALDVEVSELVHVVLGSDNTEPVTEHVFLQELLSQILDVSLLESGDVGLDGDLSLAQSDLDGIAEVASLASDFDLLLEESRLEKKKREK